MHLALNSAKNLRRPGGGSLQGNMAVTMEALMEDRVILLDLASMSSPVHVCSKHGPRAKRRVLSFCSAHPKCVIPEVAINSLSGASEKSCLHTINCFGHQVARLKARDYVNAVVRSVTQTLL